MPYLDRYTRGKIDPALDPLLGILSPSTSPGIVCYVISRVLGAACGLSLNKRTPSFELIAGRIGALESAKLEFYRQIGGPYEDQKKEVHGDVYR